MWESRSTTIKKTEIRKLREDQWTHCRYLSGIPGWQGRQDNDRDKAVACHDLAHEHTADTWVAYLGDREGKTMMDTKQWHAMTQLMNTLQILEWNNGVTGDNLQTSSRCFTYSLQLQQAILNVITGNLMINETVGMWDLNTVWVVLVYVQ